MYLAYKYVLLSIMLVEANFAAKNMALQLQLPIRESNLSRTYFSDLQVRNPILDLTPSFGGALDTETYGFGFSDNGRIDVVDKLRPWGATNAMELNKLLMRQSSVIDTNGAYKLASNWLAALSVDVARLEEIGSAKLNEDDIRNGILFSHDLAKSNDAVSIYLGKRFSEATRLMCKMDGMDGSFVKAMLRLELNRVIYGPWLYDEERFRGVTLRRQTVSLVETCRNSTLLMGKEKMVWGLGPIAQCNRALLEDVYPSYLVRERADRPRVEQEYGLENGVKKLKPIFWVRWGHLREHSVVDVELDGRTRELVNLHIHDDTILQCPPALGSNWADLVKISDETFLSYSAPERKALVARFCGITYNEPKPYPFSKAPAEPPKARPRP